MTRFEIRYLLKFLAVLLVPIALVYYLVEIAFDYFFNSPNGVSVEELLSKSITIIIVVGMIKIFRKEDENFYTQENLVSGVYLTFNAALFLFLVIILLFGIEVLANWISGTDIFDSAQLAGIVFNVIVITVFIIINLTKNIKLLR